MIGIDTNILVRAFVSDHEEQMHASRTMLANLGDDQVFLSNIVLVEFVWVLLRSYKRSKTFIVGVLELLLGSDDFDIQNRPAVRLALDGYSNGKADFADYLIFAVAKLDGANKLYSFDQAAVKFIPDVRNLMEEQA